MAISWVLFVGCVPTWCGWITVYYTGTRTMSLKVIIGIETPQGCGLGTSSMHGQLRADFIAALCSDFGTQRGSGARSLGDTTAMRRDRRQSFASV